VFFNDPLPCADPAERAVKMAMAMREAFSSRVDQLSHIECCDRPPKTPQLQISEILQRRNRLDRTSDAAADQDLPILGLSTKPGGEVAYRADRGVAGAFGKADLTQGRIALRDASAETKFAAIATASRNQCARRPIELKSGSSCCPSWFPESA